MQKLADDTGTLALIAVRDGDRMLLAKTWRPRAAATIWLEPGHRIPIFGSSSGQAVLSVMGADRFATLDADAALSQFRAEGYDQLIGQGFVIAREDTRYASTVNAVSVPYYATEFGEAVAFTCGALPRDLPQDTVRALETQTGHASALTRRG
jgi:DNA-binding IclR family transcriptional regulator